MGYRSHVTFVVTGPRERVLALLAHWRLAGNRHMREALDELIVMPHGKAEDDLLAICFDESDTKWYPSYPDVQALERIWSECCRLEEPEDSGETGFEGAFVRIGEDSDDNETRNLGAYGCELISLSRVVECAVELDRAKDVRPRLATPATATPERTGTPRAGPSAALPFLFSRKPPMNRNRNLSILAAALLATGLASAQSSYSLQNDGRVQNTASTYAAVTGDGTSNSVAKGQTAASSGGSVAVNPIAGGAELAVSGWSATSGSGMAFNVSTGSGNGSAVSQGLSDARTFGDAAFANAHGAIAVGGSTDSGMTDAVRNGVDYKVATGTSQDGFAGGSSNGSFAAGGWTTQTPIAGGATVSAGVWDTKASQSTADAGGVTFTDGVPAGQSAAYRSANAGTDVKASAWYVDPAAAK